MYKDLEGKVALITGIGQMGNPNMWGNGAAISKVLACENGVKVFGCDLHLDTAEHTKNRIEAEGGICEVMAADGELYSLQRFIDWQKLKFDSHQS